MPGEAHLLPHTEPFSTMNVPSVLVSPTQEEVRQMHREARAEREERLASMSPVEQIEAYRLFRIVAMNSTMVCQPVTSSSPRSRNDDNRRLASP